MSYSHSDATKVTDGVDTALVSPTGRLLVETQGGAGGTSATDDGAFTVGTDAVTPAGAIYRSVRDLVDDNDVGAIAMTQRRGLLVALETPNGDSVMDEANDAVRVNIVAGSSSGVQYTEGDTDASITGTAVLWEAGGDTLQPISNSFPLPVDVLSSQSDYFEGTVDASIVGVPAMWEDAGDTVVPVSAATPLPVNIVAGSSSGVQYTEGDTDASITGTAALMEVAADTLQPIQGTVADGLLVNLGANNDVTVTGAALTSLQLIDDTVVTLGTDTYTEATSKGQTIGAVRRDADTTLVNTTNEWGPLQMDANGRLKVEAFSGETLPVSNGGTFVTQENGSALTALQLIDDIVYTDDTSTHATGTSKGALIMAAATPTDGSVNANDIGAVGMTTDRKLHVAVMDALPAGTNGIGKLTANSGVDIGDVDVTTCGTITPGTGATNLGKAEDGGHTTGDVGVFSLGVRNDTPNADVTNASADYSQLSTDRVGGIRTALYETDFAVLGTNHVKKYYTNAGAVTDGIVWSPAAGKRWYVTDIFLNVSAAATVTLEDDKAGGDEVVWKAELAANSGWSHHFGTPLFSGEDAADLLITTTAGNVYLTLTGYEI